MVDRIFSVIIFLALFWFAIKIEKIEKNIRAILDRMKN